MAAPAEAPASVPGVPPGVDPLFYATMKFNRRDYDAAIEICTHLLEVNPLDTAVWLLKTRALTENAWIDDTELEEEGVADLLMDDNAVAQAPRPGTSVARPGTSRATGVNQLIRPVTANGRPVTGFLRPGSSATGSARPALARALCEYLLFVDHNPRKCVELAAEATVAAGFSDWWWKARLGKCYYNLGLMREAERQFKSSLGHQEMIAVFLQLANVYLRLDQPNAALETYTRAQEACAGDTLATLGMARVHDMMGEMRRSVLTYRRVLTLDAANAEAIACLASNHFYSDQPEVALKFYRRLLQMGVYSAELWNNLGLCCYYSGQYDMTLTCFERAIALADNAAAADIWFNLGLVGVGIGDIGLAQQAFRVASASDSQHGEALVNLGVLEARQKNFEAARGYFRSAQSVAPHLFEAHYNGALLAYKLGEFQEAFEMVGAALEVFPDHHDSQELKQMLDRLLCAA